MDRKNVIQRSMIGVLTFLFLAPIKISGASSRALGCVSVPMPKISK